MPTISSKERREAMMKALDGCKVLKKRKNPFPRRMETLRKKSHGDEHMSGRSWRMCGKKRAYNSEAICRRVEAEALAKRGERLRHYWCDRCHKWHLTKRFREDGDGAGDAGGKTLSFTTARGGAVATGAGDAGGKTLSCKTLSFTTARSGAVATGAVGTRAGDAGGKTLSCKTRSFGGGKTLSFGGGAARKFGGGR